MASTTEPDASGPCASGAGAILTIDLDAIQANYRLLGARAAPAECAAVVKADGYGLGAVPVARALAAAGCKRFFVAHLGEGIEIRAALPEAEIHVLNGPQPGTEEAFVEHRLTPVLNHLGALALWTAEARRRGHPLPGTLHVDTGMARLGLDAAELDRLVDDRSLLEGVAPRLLMSHLACADTPEHPLNREQLAAFHNARKRLPDMPASFSASSGIFLGADWRFDLVRPGAALYGVAPQEGAPNPLAQVVRLQGKILQVREIDSPRTVGYGATWKAAAPSRIATVAVGYADGYLRSASNRGTGWLEGIEVPLVGRVSMDLTTFDVSRVPPHLARPGALIDLIGPNNIVDAVAAAAGTIGYEILTSLGRRYHRVYRGSAA